jgi:two-component system cell cycle sensor histidine kinase/response regulator CckA
LLLAAEHKASIDLLVTDMVMPGMTGRELARRLEQQRTGVGVIYMSGYSEQTAVEAAEVDTGIRLLTKPFSRGSMLRAVRDALNVRQNASGGTISSFSS